MLTKDTILVETMRVFKQVDGGQYPETVEYLRNALSDGGLDEPYEMASVLVDLDRPAHLPDFLLAFIADLYGMAIEAGSAGAMNDLGAMYYDGKRGFEQSFEKAVHWYEMAARHGDRMARQNLGYCYYYGRVAPPDYEKAYQCFAAGALEGGLVSLYKLGDMYRNGYYVDREPELAFRLYKRCLDQMQGDDVRLVGGPVHLRLGDMCLEGEGTAPDAEMALYHYHMAELMLYRMIQDGDYMYKKSLHNAIEGQKRARDQLAQRLPEDEWTFD